MSKFFLSAILSMCSLTALGQFGMARKILPPEQVDDKMKEWFTDAKVGVFIHWGIYAVDGTVESWPMQDGVKQAKAYMTQLNRFNPRNYNPEKWAALFKTLGAKYVVMTTKHHDGVALWNTRQARALSIPAHSPYKKDIIAPLFNALRKEGIKCGAYFSNPDWSYPDYPRYTKDSVRYDPARVPDRWARFISFYKGQLQELMKGYKPDLLWFDMPEYNADMMQAAATRKMLLEENPHVVINSRLAEHGDYNNPEQDLFAARPADKYWEFAIPVTEGKWGYRAGMNEASDPGTLITLFARVLAQGGNFLFDVGPDGNGEIIPAQTKCLEEIGGWINKHQEAIYGTKEGIGFEVCGFPTTYSKDSAALFVFVPHGNKVVNLNGVDRNITASIIGSGTLVPAKSGGIPGCYGWFTLNIPDQEEDKYMTVIKLTAPSGKPIKQRMKGGYIE
ncbi:alpha-L-fucosidase [Chitinophaga defluvii]|uniref:alpha-L-fucosidase n=1 Tax=Chitinophaga defluvii TaxID=3163343 RepID=A0ABV2T085_9BACT